MQGDNVIGEDQGKPQVVAQQPQVVAQQPQVVAPQPQPQVLVQQLQQPQPQVVVQQLQQAQPLQPQVMVMHSHRAVPWENSLCGSCGAAGPGFCKL